jgi:magnesium chelatase subunit I
MNTVATIGELRATDYQPLPIKAEMRKNILVKLAANEPLFDEVLGYENTVIPQIENAILSGQDIILLGERGQAKTRIARGLTGLLDDFVPVIAGCEINDNPFEPICASCRERVAERGDETLIDWLPRDRRYGEKLATPDTTIADLIGEVDPIKVAEGRYLADEETIHFGLIPRTNRGIFCINELPDLAERIQVGLLNIMEERDVQIRGYKIRLPIDVFVVASANPEDYTNRGRIITPLKDRCGSEIRTHYPRSTELEIQIMEQERMQVDVAPRELIVPQHMREIVAEVTHLARKSPDISQRSGVSVRVSISNYENVISNAVKRAVRLNENTIVPRVSDLPAMAASTTGKIELETIGDMPAEKIVDKLIQAAVVNVFNRYFLVQEFDDVIENFESGLTLEASDATASRTYAQEAFKLTGMKSAVSKLNATGNPALVASAVEFILEGLHLNRKLNKDRVSGKVKYRK